MHGTIKIKG